MDSDIIGYILSKFLRMNQIPTAISCKIMSEQGMLLDRWADLCCLSLISPALANNGLVGMGLLYIPVARESVAEEEYFDILGKSVVVILAEQKSIYTP